MRVRGLTAAAATAAVAVVGAAGATHAAAPSGAARTLVLTGDVMGLYPGSRRPLVLRVRNRNRFAVRVVAGHVTVRDANSRCRSANLRVSGFRGSVRVQAFGTARLRLLVRMSPSAPNACQRAVFPLILTARAVR
jgi:hypothetical protein